MRGRPSAEKRRKELARQERKRDKAARRAERKLQRPNGPDRADGDVDPDIAGIIPGPQPLPFEDEPETEGPDSSVVRDRGGDVD
jgi:hypothetical protein